MRLTDFKVLSFDCYGTLIDWESGIYEALQPLLARVRTAIGRDEALETFGRHESAQEAETPTLIYSELLAVVHRRLAQAWRAAPDAGEALRFGASVADWPAFPDSASALRYLKGFYRLVILSNVDRASFARSRPRLEIDFDAVYTAEEIGSYKPDPRNFGYLLNRLAARGFVTSDILHTAQSLYHDHVPAKRAGLASAWIDRRHDQEGPGATALPKEKPRYDLRFTSLAEMVEAHKADLHGPS